MAAEGDSFIYGKKDKTQTMCSKQNGNKLNKQNSKLYGGPGEKKWWNSSYIVKKQHKRVVLIEMSNGDHKTNIGKNFVEMLLRH